MDGPLKQLKFITDKVGVVTDKVADGVGVVASGVGVVANKVGETGNFIKGKIVGGGQQQQQSIANLQVLQKQQLQQQQAEAEQEEWYKSRSKSRSSWVKITNERMNRFIQTQTEKEVAADWFRRHAGSCRCRLCSRRSDQLNGRNDSHGSRTIVVSQISSDSPGQ